MFHRLEDIFLDSPVIFIQSSNNILYVLAFGALSGWTWIFDDGELRLLGKSFEKAFFHISQRADETELPLKVRLVRYHGANFAAKKDVEKECFDNVVFVMGQSQFIASVIPGEFEEPFSSKPGT